MYKQADKGDEEVAVFIELVESQALALATANVQIPWDVWVSLPRMDREAIYTAYKALRNEACRT